MNEGRVCCINHVALRNVARPSLYFEQVDQEDGGFEPGRRIWGAVTFEADVDPFDYTGNFSKVTLVIGPTESWAFFDAKIALMPSAKLDRNQFVLIFDRCERVVT